MTRVGGHGRSGRLRRERTHPGDTGSVLPLVVGVVVILAALVTVVTDVSVLWLQRRSLQATVDGAALAGAQGVDARVVYAGGARGDLPLDPVAARAAARAYARAIPSARALVAFRITSVVVTGPTVTVRAQATASPPFLAFLTGRGVAVVAEASARSSTG